MRVTSRWSSGVGTCFATVLCPRWTCSRREQGALGFRPSSPGDAAAATGRRQTRGAGGRTAAGHIFQTALSGEGNGARARAQHHPRQLQVTCPEGLTHFSERTCTWRVRVTRWSGPGAGVGVPLKGNERPGGARGTLRRRRGSGGNRRTESALFLQIRGGDKDPAFLQLLSEASHTTPSRCHLWGLSTFKHMYRFPPTAPPSPRPGTHTAPLYKRGHTEGFAVRVVRGARSIFEGEAGRSEAWDIFP